MSKWRVKNTYRVGSRAGLVSIAMISVAALLLTSCTGTSGEATAATAPTTNPPETVPDEEVSDPGETGDAASSDTPTTLPVQDIWIWENVFTVADDGELIDLTEQMVDGLTWDSSATVELAEGVHFTPVPQLAPQMLHTATEVRADLDMVAGVAEYKGRQKIQIIATPTAEKSVEFNDRIVMDLGHLGLDVGAPLIVDYAFAQAIPAADVDDGADGAEILRARLADERFHWYAVDEPEAEGGINPGLRTAVGSVPDLSSVTGEIIPAGFTTGSETQPSVSTALYDRSSAVTITPATSSGGSAGGTTAKDPPELLPVPDLRKCLRTSLKCVSEYFKNQRSNSKAINNFLNQNLKPKTPKNEGNSDSSVCVANVKGSNCGTTGGDPHLKTFDGARIDLQQVGEFLAAHTDDFEVQIRTAPWGSSETISVVSGLAISFGDHRLTVQLGQDPMMLLDGSPLDMSDYEPVELGDYGITYWADVLAVRGPDGLAAGASGVSPGSGALHVAVDTGVADRQWQGLMGDANGDRHNDFQSRDGTILPQPATQSDYYASVSNTWRISDAESLFDYQPDENTATFTDMTFPRTIMTFDDIDPGLRQQAATVCITAGVTEPHALQDCIFDFAVTSDMSFVRASQYLSRASLLQLPQGWFAAVDGMSNVAAPAVFTADDLLLVPATGRDHNEWLVALDQSTGEERWRFDTGGLNCVAATAAGRIVVPHLPADADYDRGLAELDPADGSILTDFDLADQPRGFCRSIVSVGETVVMSFSHFSSGVTELLGYDAVAGQPLFTTPIAAHALTNLAVSDDGTVWLGANHDDGATIYQLDAATGATTAHDLAAIVLNDRIATTNTGIATSFKNEADTSTGGIIWVDASGVYQQVDLPTDDFTYIPYGRLAAGEGYVAAYPNSDIVSVFDERTGQPLQQIRPRSFSNNGGQIAIHQGQAIVGNFGSDHFLEAYDLASGASVWSLTDDLLERGGMPSFEVKYIGPPTDDGLLVVSGPIEDAIVVGLVGPGSAYIN